MNRINELIAEHCPDGVEFIGLGELLNYSQPGKYLVKSTAYDASFDTPVLTAGQTFILGYTDETEGIYRASSDEPVIIFDDFTTAFKWVNFNFKAKSSAMKMLTPKPGVDLRYVWFAMQTIFYSPQDHARQWIGTYSQFRIPVPPLEVQRAIVEVLDTFSKLEAELEAELEARKQQYAHYRREVLSFSQHTSWGQLSDVVEYVNGKAHEKLADPDGDVAMVTARFISRNGEANRFLNLEDVLTPALVGDVAMVLSDLPNGRALARTFYVDRDDTYAINQRVARLRVKDQSLTDPKFVHYFLDRNAGLLRYDNGFDQTHLSKSQVTGLPFPLLSLPEQERIVSILDKFDALVNDLSIGLPAELAARRQQYEYYRDKLFTFKELETAA